MGYQRRVHGDSRTRQSTHSTCRPSSPLPWWLPPPPPPSMLLPPWCMPLLPPTLLSPPPTPTPTPWPMTTPRPTFSSLSPTMAPVLFLDRTLSTFPMAGSRPSPTTPTTSLATLLRLPTLVSLSTPPPLLVAMLPLPLSTLSTPLPTQLFTMPLFLSMLSTTDLPMVLLPTEALSTTDKHLRKAGC